MLIYGRINIKTIKAIASDTTVNILVLCLSPGKGGLELYARRSTKIIEELGHQCITVSNPNSTVFKANNEPDKKRIFSLKTSFHLLPLYAALKLARIIDTNNIDVIHIHWSKDFNLAVFAKLFSSRHVKLIYTRHMAITRYKNDFYHKFLYRHVDRFIVITKQLMKEACQFLPLPESKIKLLHHGINKPNLKAPNCDKFKLTHTPGNYLHIAIFSRIEEGKGQHLLVEAARALKDRNKEIHVTVIGHVMDQVYYQNLETSIRKYNLNTQFHFHPFIESASAYMSCFDVIALTTHTETFGLVLIEAMQAGVAVIGSNAGGVPEIINDQLTGLLFEPGDVESLTRTIEYYYDNPDSRKKMATQGQKFVAVNFSEQQHKNSLNKILEDF